MPISTPASESADPAMAAQKTDPEPPRESRLGLGGRLIRHRTGRAGLVLMGIFAVTSLVGPLLVRGSRSSDSHFQDLGSSFLPPSGAHPLGTDQFGRDILVRLVLGAHYTLGLGIAAVLLGLAFGVSIGAVSGYLGGWVDMLVQRGVDILLSFPSFLLALALLAAFGPGLSNLVIAVAIGSVPRFIRLLRASVLRTRELPYVEAAKALGMGRVRLIAKHVVPNSFDSVLVQIPLELSSAILTAAGLGFLGFGVQPPTPEWGAMLGEAREYIFKGMGPVAFPGICIFAVVLGANLLGDGVRDSRDPRLR